MDAAVASTARGQEGRSKRAHQRRPVPGPNQLNHDQLALISVVLGVERLTAARREALSRIRLDWYWTDGPVDAESASKDPARSTPANLVLVGHNKMALASSNF